MPDEGRPDYRARAAAGIRALQRWYLPRTGLLRFARPAGLWKTTGWWNAANALMAVIRYRRHTGDSAHAAIVATTFGAARHQHADFLNWFFDDSAWWALAWVAAYDLTGEDRYLAAARTIFAHNTGGWDDRCGGGVWWNQERTYKNAITNELFFTLAAQLHQRIPGDQDYLAWAIRAWDWFDASGMIGPDGLVNDGLTAACANNGGTTWTYNQGVILGGLAALYEITGDRAYLHQGEVIADATLSMLTNPAGILAEPCEPTGCDSDQTQFKGIFVRYLHEFCRHSGKPAYPAFITANADSVWDKARNEADQFGLRWAGPFDRADASRQSSAVEVLTAAAGLTGPSRIPDRSR
ncbi:MAG TPA: glycoside hydrolase family 76 protein [Trebonia sp.]